VNGPYNPLYMCSNMLREGEVNYLEHMYKTWGWEVHPKLFAMARRLIELEKNELKDKGWKGRFK
jgi:hypothetical protein